MRHIPLATLYPWLELICPVCGQDSDHPVEAVDYEQIQNSTFHQPVCHCGHRFSKIETEQRGSLYG